MANIVRIRHNREVHYAIVDGEDFRLIRGDVFSDWAPAPIIIPSRDAALLAPVVPPQIIGIGANYRKHCVECNVSIPDHPLVFFKLVSALIGPGETIRLPKIAPYEVDWEAELVVVIRKRCKAIIEEEADDYILGYTCGNDISARDCQLRIDKQWARGKSFDTFAPIGPWISTGLDGDNLGIRLMRNGEVMQDSHTSDMIFSCRRIVHYLSHSMTLLPGSIIMTGTPAGVGMGLKPPQYLRPGDRLTVEIEGVGKLHNAVSTEE